MKKMKDQFNWDDFKVEEIEKKHEIREKAKRDGMGDEPPTNSEGLSVSPVVFDEAGITSWKFRSFEPMEK